MFQAYKNTHGFTELCQRLHLHGQASTSQEAHIQNKKYETQSRLPHSSTTAEQADNNHIRTTIRKERATSGGTLYF